MTTIEVNVEVAITTFVLTMKIVGWIVWYATRRERKIAHQIIKYEQELEEKDKAEFEKTMKELDIVL